jgi:hypothetical protein
MNISQSDDNDETIFYLEYDFIEKSTTSSSILTSDDFYKKIEKLVSSVHDVNNYNLSEFNHSSVEIFSYIYSNNSNTLSRTNNRYLDIIVRLILFMRDINGFEKTIPSFHLLYTLASHDFETFKYIFQLFVKRVGSWKDVKKFYQFIHDEKPESDTLNQSIINYLVQLTTQQLKTDIDIFNLNINLNEISLVAKWIPREKTKYNKLYELLAYEYHTDYFQENMIYSQKLKAMNKAKMNYRKLIASLNRHLDTLEIKQCGRQWSKIDPHKQTSRSLQLQMNAFLNKTADGDERYELSDRIICASNFEDYLNEPHVANSSKKIYFENKSLVDLIHHLHNERYDL